jgi:hypothetical protein
VFVWKGKERGPEAPFDSLWRRAEKR